MKNYFKDREILVTGGTGSLGNAIVDQLIGQHHGVKGIRIYSRDELKQWEMQKKYASSNVPISFLIGDVRDLSRLMLATNNVDVIIHAAALKQVPTSEANPIENIRTNIDGANNVLLAALENKVEKVMAISTDKACYPANLYGATKMCMEKIFIQGDTYSGGRSPAFSCVRYGNVLGSRGSVVPLFKEQYKKTGIITITHPKMTRFWIHLDTVSEFIINSIIKMEGGEIFIPRMFSASVLDIAKVLFGEEVRAKVTGIRPGEKLHEVLVTSEESTRTIAYHDRLIIRRNEVPNANRFIYASNTNGDNLLTSKHKNKIITELMKGEI
jgi:FlaA1/EpsC-like NDP-sugar epimerase